MRTNVALAQGIAQAEIVLDSSWVKGYELAFIPASEVLKVDLREATSIPQELFACTQLEELHLGTSKISFLPEDFARLTQLHTLYLDRTWYLDHNEALRVLATLPNLRNLSLRYCNLATLPPSLFSLTQLQNLNLELNLFEEIPAEVKQLKLLEVLALGLNQNLRKFPESLKGLPNLRILSLEQTKLENLPTSWNAWPKLERLFLSATELKSLPPSLSVLPFLKEIGLAACKQMQWEKALSVLAQVPGLRVLNLNNNDFQPLPEGKIWGFNLDTLSVTHSFGTLRLLPSIAKIAGIRYLDLQGASLGEQAESLTVLQELRYLDLSANNLTRLPQTLERLFHLETIVLQYNDLRPEAYGVLRGLPGLQTLRISYGKYNERELQSIQQLLSGVLIAF